MQTDPYELLKTKQVKDITQTQMNATVKNDFVSKDSAIQDIVSLHNVKLAASTFGGNGVLPDSGAITATNFTDSAAGSSIRPEVGEVWLIENLLLGSVVNGSSSTNTITLKLSDGVTDITIFSVGAAAGVSQLGNPATGTIELHLTNDLFLKVLGSQSDESILQLPYLKVAM